MLSHSTAENGTWPPPLSNLRRGEGQNKVYFRGQEDLKKKKNLKTSAGLSKIGQLLLLQTHFKTVLRSTRTLSPRSQSCPSFSREADRDNAASTPDCLRMGLQ